MSYILREQREYWDDPAVRDADFSAYLAHLEATKLLLPESAYAIATHRRWYGFDGYGPHDSGLVRMVVSDHNPEETEEPSRTDISIFLQDGEIKEIRYWNVVGYSLMVTASQGDHHGAWIYDEFSLSGIGQFSHTIQWSNGREWTIRAREIEVIR